MYSGAFSGGSRGEPRLSWSCRNSWKSASRCKVGPRAQKEHVIWMGSASGGNKNGCRKWKYFVQNFSSLGGPVTESNNLQKLLSVSKQKDVKVCSGIKLSKSIDSLEEGPNNDGSLDHPFSSAGRKWHKPIWKFVMTIVLSANSTRKSFNAVHLFVQSWRSLKNWRLQWKH